MATAAGAKTAADSNATLLSCHSPVSSPAEHHTLFSLGCALTKVETSVAALGRLKPLLGY